MSLESVDKQNPHKLVPHNFDDFTVLALLRFALALKFKLNFKATKLIQLHRHAQLNVYWYNGKQHSLRL